MCDSHNDTTSLPGSEEGVFILSHSFEDSQTDVHSGFEECDDEDRVDEAWMDETDDDTIRAIDHTGVNTIGTLEARKIEEARKRRRKMLLPIKEELSLKCEWRDCSFVSTDMSQFLTHVSRHIPQLELRQQEDGAEFYVCLWEACGFETEHSDEVIRHVNYHSYHTRLKNIGANISSRCSLPKCTYDIETRNRVPEVEEMRCGWGQCGRTFNNVQAFLYHVGPAHVLDGERGKRWPCFWIGCKAVFMTRSKLSYHVRTHTREKTAACPTCGSLFVSATKFHDHCTRQLPAAQQRHQCSHCSKYYASERILRDHMRLHVNHYKCCYCDMTCPTPATLAAHIRHRHLDTRPFTCSVCTYACKTKKDLRNHLRTHDPDKQYSCDEKGCKFSCRAARTLERHYRQVHSKNCEPLYCCHICEKRFDRGADLTRHLFAAHSLRWPSGHTRFLYRHGEDGYCRLQTVRYESVEVTEEMLKDSYNDSLISDQMSEEGVDDVSSELDPVSVLIEELDEKGDVVKSSTVKLERSLPRGARLVQTAEVLSKK